MWRKKDKDPTNMVIIIILFVVLFISITTIEQGSKTILPEDKL